MKLRKDLLAVAMVGLLALYGAACEQEAGEVEDETVTPLPEETLDETLAPTETELDTGTPTETET